MHKVKFLLVPLNTRTQGPEKHLYQRFSLYFYFYSFGNNEENYWHAVMHEQPDGTYTLNESPSMECWTGPHILYSNMAFFFCNLRCRIPLFCIFTISNIFKNKREFDPDMRDRYGYLYYKYKTTHFYWEPIVIMPRKVFIALFRILTRPKEYHLLQASGIMIFLSGLTILQIKQQPFIEVFLNNMENVALTNHVFVLFFGVMFLSKALAPSEPGKPPNIMTENMYAFIMIGHMMATFAYLAHGVFKELWEMGLFQAGFNDLQNIILQQKRRFLETYKAYHTIALGSSTTCVYMQQKKNKEDAAWIIR